MIWSFIKFCIGVGITMFMGVPGLVVYLLFLWLCKKGAKANEKS